MVTFVPCSSVVIMALPVSGLSRSRKFTSTLHSSPMFSCFGARRGQAVIFKRSQVFVSGDTIRYTINIISKFWSKEHSGLYLYVWYEDRRRRNQIIFNNKLENHIVKSFYHSCGKKHLLEFYLFDGTPTPRNNTVYVRDLSRYYTSFGRNVYCAVFLDVFGDGNTIIPYHNNLERTIKDGHAAPNNIPVMEDKYRIKLP
jgi:hypothetical protein